MLYVSLPFLKGRLPFLKGHTLIPKAKIRLSFGLPKVSWVFWGEIPGQAGNDVGEIPGQARNEEGAMLERSTAGATKWAQNVPWDVLEHGWGYENGSKRAARRAGRFLRSLALG